MASPNHGSEPWSGPRRLSRQGPVRRSWSGESCLPRLVCMCVHGTQSLRSQQRRAPAPCGHTSSEQRDSWTSQSVHRLTHQARAAAPACCGDHSSLGPFSTDLCPLDAENAVMHSFIQKRKLLSTYCGQPCSRHCPCSVNLGEGVRQQRGFGCDVKEQKGHGSELSPRVGCARGTALNTLRTLTSL